MFIIQAQSVDYDDWPIGLPYGKVGPFDTWEEAEAFLDKHFDRHAYGWKNQMGDSVNIVNPLISVKSPEEYEAEKTIIDSRR